MSPEVLEAMTTSAGAWRLTWASTRCLSSSCSGMFSWMKSTCAAMAFRSVVKESVPLGGSGASVRRGERAFRVRHRAADPVLHLRLDVRGEHVDAEVQRARRPAAADDSRTQKTERLHLSHDSRTIGCRAQARTRRHGDFRRRVFLMSS